MPPPVRRAHKQKHAVLMVVGSVGMAMLSGCTSPTMERQNVHLYPVPTTEGTGWLYRSGEPSEAIQVGGSETVSFEALKRDAAYIKRLWAEHSPTLMHLSDNASDYALLAFTDIGTQRMNPLKGGVYAWDIAGMAEEIRKTVEILNPDAPKYSVHLLATADDQRPQMSPSAVAQVRLRRVVDAFMQEGYDPRLITGQVIEPNNKVRWKFAIALRPYEYGEEARSHQLISPWSL